MPLAPSLAQKELLQVRPISAASIRAVDSGHGSSRTCGNLRPAADDSDADAARLPASAVGPNDGMSSNSRLTLGQQLSDVSRSLADDSCTAD